MSQHRQPTTDNRPLTTDRQLATAIGLVGTAVISISPLVFGKTPAALVTDADRLVTFELRPLILVIMWVIIGCRAWLDRQQGDTRPFLANAMLGIMAAFLACWHWYAVDSVTVATPNGGSYRPAEAWQKGTYFSVLDHRKKIGTQFFVPHVYRPLPYGFARSIELCTGDWYFACSAYRWFYTYWFLWCSLRFCRYFHPDSIAWAAVALIGCLYPFSLWYYMGQLTDPMSHALFVLAMLYILEDRWWPLAVSLGLGVAAKETAVVLVVGYWSCYWRQGGIAVVRAAGLMLACVAAYFATRLPLGWALDFESINATSKPMFARNLELKMDWVAYRLRGSENYILPLVFVGVFIPGIIRNWKSIDQRLRALVVTVTPLVLMSNICFGWMHEARNYLPLVPLLAAAAVPPGFEMPWKATTEKISGMANRSFARVRFRRAFGNEGSDCCM